MAKPMSITLEANLKTIDEFKKLKRSIRTGVIERGLDKVLFKAIDELKSRLKSVVNEEIRYKKDKKGEDELTETVVDVPKADKDLIKYIFNVDLTKVKTAADFTKLINDNAFVITNNRVRLQVPETPDGNMEQSYAMALAKFRNSIFIDTTHAIPKYFVVNNFNPQPWVKIVCSRDNGVTSNSQKKYHNYKNSNKMPTQANSEQAGRYSQWTLNQAGVQQIKQSSLDITAVMDKIKSGEFEDAVDLLKHTTGGKNLAEAQQKVANIRDRKDLTPTVEAYTNIISLIRNLRIQKKILDDRTEYSLVSDYSDDFKGWKKFFPELKKNIGFWVMVNEDLWFHELVRIANQIIERYEE